MKTTRYFSEQVLRKRPYLKIEWCQFVVENPICVKKQEDHRIRFWGKIQDSEGKERILRVITLEDKVTLHNAFFDRNFKTEESL